MKNPVYRYGSRKPAQTPAERRDVRFDTASSSVTNFSATRTAEKYEHLALTLAFLDSQT